MLAPVTDMLFGGVQDGTTEGGSLCYSSMSLSWRFADSLVGGAVAGAICWHLRGRRTPLLVRLRAESRSCGVLAARFRHWLQYPLAATLWFCCWAQVLCKVLSRQGIFLLQPCHIVCFSLAIVSSLPTRDHRGELLLLEIVGVLFGPLLAMAAPDTSNLRLPGEVSLFWLEHVALAVAPFVILGVTHSHVSSALGGLRQSFDAQMSGYFLSVLVHYVIFAPISWASWANLDYQLCPPDADLPGVGTVVPRQLYRPWTAFVLFPFASWLCSSQHLKLAQMLRQVRPGRISSQQAIWCPAQLVCLKTLGEETVISNVISR